MEHGSDGVGYLPLPSLEGEIFPIISCLRSDPLRVRLINISCSCSAAPVRACSSGRAGPAGGDWQV